LGLWLAGGKEGKVRGGGFCRPRGGTAKELVADSYLLSGRKGTGCGAAKEKRAVKRAAWKQSLFFL